MGTAFRKFIAIVLSALLCLSFAPLSAFAADQKTEDGTLEGQAGFGPASASGQESSQAFDSVLAYLYVESLEVTAGVAQNIVVGISDEVAAADSIHLVYAAEDGVAVKVPATAATDGAVLFALDDLAVGAYTLLGVSYSVDGVERSENFESLEGATCTFAVLAAEAPQIQEQGDVQAYFIDEDTESLASTGDAQLYSSDALSNEDIISSVVSYVTSADHGAAVVSGASEGASERAVPSKIVVAIDPGHGGPDPGACANGLRESDLTWSIAQACKTQLESYGRYTVFFTRSQNENPKQSERVRRAVQAGAALFVSIHINSAEAASAKGSEVWIPNDHGYLNKQTHDMSEAIADKILDNLAALGLSDRGLKIKDATDDDVYDDGSPADYFTVISEARRAGIPSMIVEHAFISNASDASKLADPTFLKKLGVADAKGIASTFSFAKPQLILSAESLKPGSKLTMQVKGIQGETSDLTYNFAYKTVDDWSIWDSTAKQTGSFTSKNSYSFTLPAKTGTYEAWVNIKGANDVEQTTFPMTFTISADALDWTASSTKAPLTVALGESVTFSSDASGDDVSKLAYNYAWSYEGSWDLWDSTLKSTGKMTYDTSYTFTPTKAGTYHVWVNIEDPKGRMVTTETALVKVEKQDWTAKSTNAPKTGKVGQEIEFSAAVAGSASSLTYNYVWSYEGGWDLWGSTLKSTGKMTSAKSGSFTPTKPGTYHVWVDVEDSAGKRMTTKSVLIEINDLDWTASSTKAPASGKMGQTVTFSANVSGADIAGLTYNYAWSYGGGWSEWDSTLKSTGKMTSAKSGSFTPKKAGKYVLWVDVKDATGRTVTTKSATVQVNSYDWAVGSVAAPATSKVGQAVEFSANVTGTDASKLTYNYVWSYEGGWNLWDSTLKSTGKMTSAKSGSFTPTKAGTYHIWIDVKDPSGRTVTSKSAKVLVKDLSWTASKTIAPSTGRVGQSVTFSANAAGVDVGGLTYNYAWRYGTTWDLWDSTVKSTGKATSAKSASFTPKKAGTYQLWVNVYDVYGRTVTTSTVEFEAVGEPIMGTSQTSVDQMVRAYEKTGHSYPAKTYASRGAANIKEFCTIIYEEARAEGVRAEVLFAQVMHETGWLQFGNDVKAEQCNFGGLGATGGGVAGASFADVRTGLRAQVQHLKAYGSTLPLVNKCVDPRFHYVVRGSAPFVEDLGGKWAVGSQYGITLVTGMKALLKS